MLDQQASAPREKSREPPADKVIVRQATEDPIGLGVPPHVLPAEPVEPVVVVQDEPVVVPQRREGEVERACLQFRLPGPRHTHEKGRVEDQERHEEHVAVVAGERLATEDHGVDPRDEAGGAVPGGHLLGPAVLAFGLDLETGEDNSEQGEEQRRRNSSQHEKVLQKGVGAEVR